MNMMAGQSISNADARLTGTRAASATAPLIVGSALLMQGIDGTAIPVALPAMADA